MADWKESAKKSLESRKSNITTPVVSTPKSSSVTKAPTTGTKSSGSWKEQLKKSLDSRGYIPPEKRSYELKLNDGNNFGVVSYEAYKAITNNQIEGYTPKSESEKQAIESYKEWTKQNISKNSAYKSTKNGKKKHLIPGTSYYDETGYDDIEHDYINGDEEAIGIVNTNEATSSKFILGTDSQFLKTMTPDEKATYNYIYNVEGKEAGKKYLKDISSDLNLRQRLKSQEELAKYAKENKFTSSLATIIASPMKTISAVGQINDYLDDGKIDQNAGYNKYVYNTNAVRKSVSEEIEKGATGKVGSFLYNTGMSIGDSAMNTIASGGNKFLSLGTMGIGAFANSVVSAKDRGLSDNQAMGLGVVSAIAEIFTESFSWDKLFGAKNIGEGLFNGAEKGVKSYILDNIKTNALEEMGADAINFAADVFISKDKSEWQDSVNKYIKDGYSESKAWALTFKDTATQFALSGLAGALSGATMSGSTGIMINSHIKSVGEANSNNVLGIIGDGLSYDKNSEAYKHALKLSKSNGEITDYDIGRQVLLNDVQKINTTIGEGLKQDKNSEAYKNAKRLQKSDNVTSEDLEYQNLLNKGEKIINVGESFADSKYNISIKVVGQNKGNTTIETTNLSTGKTETKSLPSSMVNSMLLSDRYTKLETPSTTEVVEETANAESETTPQESITSEQLIETANVTTEENSTVENTEVESAAETTEAPSQKDINLKRVGKFYEVYGEEAQFLAKGLEAETTKAVVNGVETDVLRLPADLAERFADAVSDEYNLVLSDKPKAKNQSVTNETTTTDETTPSAEENATEDEISVVADAMNDTFNPEAKEQFEKSDLKGDVVKLAELVSDFYKEHKTLSSFADYFTDKGAKVISAIEGKSNVETETDNKAKVEEIQSGTVSAKDVVDIISETLTPQAKETLQDGDVNGNYVSMAETLIEVYKENGTIEDFADFFTDGGKKVEAVIKGKIDNADVAEVLKNESESDTIKSTTETNSIEREDDGNESIRESVLSGDSRRRSDESTRKQVGGISYFEQRNQGRDATERQNFARELIERGQIEEIVDGKDKYNLVKPEAYNDDMLSMVEEAKKHGIELGFFVGSAKINFGTNDEFTARGIRVSPTKIVVQYDNIKSPQKIAKHEIIHAKWKTEAVQAIRTKILESLQDTKDIFAQERYTRYKRIYKNDNLVLEEFVCDVMSGDTYYYADYIDTVNDYWYGNETVEGYNAADYATSKDAGGKDATEGRYDLSDEGGEHGEKRNNIRGISGISKESGNKRRRNTSNKRDVPSGQAETLHQNKNSIPTESRNRDKRSGSKHLVRGLESLEASGKSSGNRQDTENRRFQQAIDNNDIVTANDMLNKKAVANGYIPVKVYKGTLSDNVRTVFDKGNAIWVTPDYDYASGYSSEYSGTETEKSAQLHTEPNSNVYEFYAKYGNVLELGNIEQEINTLEEAKEFAKKTGITINEYLQCRLECKEEYGNDTPNEIWAITNTKKFAELAKNNGYDSLHALERNGIETYGILYSENVKSAKLKTYDDKGNLIPLSKRFDNTTDDIRYDIDEDSDGNTLTEEQQEYFKDSKVRDENGVLKVVYHGTRKADFTEFKRNINFFTDSEEMADSYSPNGEMYKGYLNITKPYEIDAAGEKWSKVPVDEATKQFLQEYGASVFKEGGKWRTTPADIAAAIEEAVDNGELDYDGIIIKNIDDTGSYYKGKGKHLGTDYIAFNSNQFKNADNTTPTSNPDIRYDIDDADNEYMKAVENGDVETASKLIEEAAEKAFLNSKVRGSDGKLKLVYHGRVSDFNVFDRSFANVEGNFGKGYYFTSNEYDVDANYANEEGPDLKNKISRLAERLEWEDEYSDLSYEEREEIARQRFITSEPNTITAYLNMENPVYITPDEKGTFLDFNEAYGEEYDEYGESEGLFVDFIEALKNNSYDYAYNDVDFSFLYEYAYDNGGMYASDAVKIIKDRILDELSDENGDIATNEVIRLAFEEIGFDGIIDTSVYYKFNNMNGMDSGTTHYIVFDSEQIKSADIATYDDNGNVIPLSERFNENNKDIRYDLDDEKSYAPTFYSQMGKVIDEMKQDKIGAMGVIPYLKGRGVKDEEIKWSGIETLLAGKKSVTKAELQEFVAGSQLQIETKILSSDYTIKYTDDESKSLEEISNVTNELWQKIDELWMDKYGEEIPWDIRFNDNAVSAMYRRINKLQKSDNESGDFFNDIIHALNRIEVLERNQYTIIQRAKDRTLGGNSETRTKWEQYALDDGRNYRELLFKIPNSTYTNSSMQSHWGGDAQGILAHARVQDFNVDGKKMLFIEEIQSDWHNEGAKKGYAKADDADIRAKRQELENYIKSRLGKENSAEEMSKIQEARAEYISLGKNMSNADAIPDAPFKNNYHEYVLKNLIRMAAEQGYDSIGWTPAKLQSERWSDEFAEGYRIEYDQDIPKFLNKYGKKWGAKVGKTVLGQDQTEYTEADFEREVKEKWAERWGESADINIEFSHDDNGRYIAEGRNRTTGEMFSQMMLNKNQNGTTVWSMDITDSMRDSVLYEGQPRYDIDSGDTLETQKKIESIAKEINSHDELIEVAKKNTQEFVDKIKENKSLQKRLHNAKRQMLLSPKPIVNIAKIGQVTKDILKEMDSTLKAIDLKDRVTSIYNEYFADVKKAAGVESKTQEANDNMMKKFAELAVDIADSSVAYTESEEYGLLKSYVRNTRIRIPESAKSDAHYAEFRKSHMGTFNLTNDGLEMDVAYQELCEMFPGMLDESITHPADQLYAIAEKLESLKPYAYNPHTEYMQDAIDHIVYRFVSEADGIAAMPKTKAQKIAEKGAYDKEMALEKERASFERKLDKHKKNSENIINKLQKKIGESEYVRYWEKRLSKEEKAQAVNKVRERQKVAVLKTKIRNIVSNMKKKLDKNEKTGGYPRELVKVVADVCSALDFHTDRTGKDGGPTKASLKLDALKMQYDALKDNENYDFASEYSEELSGEIQKLYNKVKDKRVIDLNATELSELKDILSEISQRLSNATKQIGKENARENAAIGSEIIESLNSRSDVVKSGQNQMLKEIKLIGQQGKSIVFNPHRINKMIAGYDMDSAWWQLYDGINRGSRKASKFVMDANKPFDELIDGGGNEVAFYDFRTKNVKTGIKYIDGSEVEIPKSIICELVMMWDRKQGRTHLETGGAKIPDMKLYNKGKTTVAITDAGKRTAPITQSDINRLKTMLDSYDKAWIEKAHYLFNNVSKNAINETSMELIGRELAKEENYIRMYVDQDFIRREIDGKKEDATLESHGSLKETVPNAKQPVVLRGLHENVYDNIDFSSKYYGLAIPIRNFNKVYNIVIRDGDSRNSVKELIGQKFGSAIRSNVVEQLIRDLQAPRPRNIEPFSNIRGKWLSATFWGNIRSALKQTTSYWTASSILSESSLAKGVVEYKRHTKQTKAEIGKYSGTLYKRSQGLSTTELGDRANRKRLAGASNKVTKLINEHAPVLRKIPEWIRPGNWLQSMDCSVSSALWEACKIEAAKTMDVSDDGYMKAVTDLYERVIEETQSNYDVAHRPEALKNTNAIMRTITMFQTDNLQQSGILFDAYNDYKTKSKIYEKDNSSANEKAKDEAKKGLSKAIRSRIYSSLWLMFVSHLGNMLLRKFKPYIDEEEKEITSGSIAKQSMLMLCDDMLGVFVPVVGSLISKVADTFSDGYDFVTEPTFDVMEDLIKSTSKIWDAFFEEDGDVLKAFADAIPSISNITGIPAKNISDLVNSIKGYAGDIKVGKFAHDITDYASGNKSFYSYGDLASCISSGDEEKEKKILDYYSANGKEVSRGSLTEEIKPAYVQMYIDSPEKARGIAIKLVKDYKYSADTINNWCYDEYLDNIVSNPEYAEEIKSAFRSGSAWKNEAFLKAAKSYYKSVYKEGNENDIDDLKNALINGAKIANSTLTQWEKEVDKKIKESERERQKDLNNLQ